MADRWQWNFRPSLVCWNIIQWTIKMYLIDLRTQSPLPSSLFWLGGMRENDVLLVELHSRGSFFKCCEYMVFESNFLNSYPYEEPVLFEIAFHKIATTSKILLEILLALTPQWAPYVHSSLTLIISIQIFINTNTANCLIDVKSLEK